MSEVRRGTYNFYKGSFIIAFYNKEDEELMYIFDNVREILAFMKRPINKTNVNIINIELYRALKSKTHFIRFLTGEMMTVHLIKKGRGNFNSA